MTPEIKIGVKICGLSKPKSVEAAIAAGTDYTGFVFFEKSPRNVTGQKAAELTKLIPDSVSKVGVFVNPDNDLLEEILNHISLDYIQLHGSESVARVAEIKSLFAIRVIKAIAVSGPQDIKTAKTYEAVADMLLFDAKPPKKDNMDDDHALPGGNGLRFDWQLIKGMTWKIPWMLSGGLNGDNIALAIAISAAKNVDISSGVEDSPGVKSTAKITDFIHKAKSI